MARASAWSADHEQYLRDHYRDRSLEEMATAVGRSACAVKTRIAKLGLSRSGRRQFTAAEDAVIRARYLDETAEAIARDLGRSAHSVHYRARVIGLHKERRFGQVIIDAVREHHGKGWSDSEIAAAVGCTRKSVSAQRIALGLPANDRSEHLRDRVKRATRRQLDSAGLNSLADLKREVVRKRCRDAGWPEDLRQRHLDILNALWDRGPMTRREIADAVGMPWKGTRSSLTSNDPEGSYLAHLIRRGLVISFKRAAMGQGRGRSCNVYSLALDVERQLPTDQEAA